MTGLLLTTHNFDLIPSIITLIIQLLEALKIFLITRESVHYVTQKIQNIELYLENDFNTHTHHKFEIQDQNAPKY